MALWASVASAIGIGTVGTLYAYHKIRPRYPAKVNCWFCGCSTTVPYGNRNCWDCPSCEQYNGFTETGDYNKPIPAQHRSELNFPISCAKDKFLGHVSVLCDTCQQNQLLKVQQLANFVPLSESTFEEEVEEYRAYLERAYDLCPSCQQHVQEELNKQDAVLYANLSRYCREMALKSATYAYTQVSGLLHAASLSHLGTTLLLLLLALVLAVLHGAAIAGDQLLQSPLPGWLGEGAAALASVVAWSQDWQAVLLVAGLSACLLSKMAAGKDRLYIGDVVSFCCWLVLFTLHQTDVVPGLAAGRELCGVEAWVCLPNVLAALWCCTLDRRLPRNLTSTSMHRRTLHRSPALNTSGQSETSTTAVSSVSTSRRCRQHVSPPSHHSSAHSARVPSSSPFPPTPNSSRSASASPLRAHDTSPEPSRPVRLPGFGQSFRSTVSCPNGVSAAPRPVHGSSVRFGGTQVLGQGPGYTRSGSLFRKEVLSDWTPAFGSPPTISAGSPLGFTVTHPPTPKVFQSAGSAKGAVPAQPGPGFGLNGSSSFRSGRPPSALAFDSASSVGRTSIFGSEIPPAKMPAKEVEDEDELDLEIEAINLGTTRLPRSDSGIFSMASSGLGQNAAARKPGEPRPLITPAKLDVVQFRSPTPGSHATSSSVDRNTPSSDKLQQGQHTPLTEDRLSHFNRQTSSEGGGISDRVRRLSLMRRCRTESVSADEDEDPWEAASLHTGTTLAPADSSTSCLPRNGWRRRAWQGLVSVGLLGQMALATYLLLLFR